VDPPRLRKLREAGCAMICFGLESGNQKILDRANKRTTVEKARQAVAMAKEAGISCLGSFVLGLPGETRETMEETLSFARSLDIPHGFHLLAPFPGTRIRERAGEYGLQILSDDWSLYDADHALTETADLRAAEVESFARTFFQNLGAEIDRMKAETLAGTYTGPYREEMEKRLEVDFAWKLLSEDLLEEKGEIPKSEVMGPGRREDPFRPLVERIAAAVSMDRTFAGSKLRKLSERGLIRCQETTHSFRWHWKEP